MTELMAQLDAATLRARDRMDMVKAILRERQIPIELVRRTRHYYNFYLTTCSDLATERRILAELCPPLRTEVLMFLNARAVMHIDFFRGQDTTFVASVCKLLKPSFAAPNDYIFREGELGLEMFFVQSGTVEILCNYEGEELRLDYQEQGSYFGEVALLLEGRPREASVRAVTFCNMYSFSKDSLDYLLRLYPEVGATMQQVMERRLKRWRFKRVGNIIKRQRCVAGVAATAASAISGGPPASSEAVAGFA